MFLFCFFFVFFSTGRLVLSLAFCYCAFSPFSIAISSLGEERANLSTFRCFFFFFFFFLFLFFFYLRLFGFVCFLFPLVSWKGCGL